MDGPETERPLEARVRFLSSICVLLVFGSSLWGCKPEAEAATKAEVTAMRKRLGQLERRIDALEKRPQKGGGNKAKAGKSPTGKSPPGKAGNKGTPGGKSKTPAGKSSGKAPGKAPGKGTSKAPAGKSPGKAPAGKANNKVGADG